MFFVCDREITDLAVDKKPYPVPSASMRRCERPPINSRVRKISTVHYDLSNLKAPMLLQLLASLPLG